MSEKALWSRVCVGRTPVFNPVLSMRAYMSDVCISIMHSAQLMIDSRSHDKAFTAGSSVNRRNSSHRHPHVMLSCVFWVARALH